MGMHAIRESLITLASCAFTLSHMFIDPLYVHNSILIITTGVFFCLHILVQEHIPLSYTTDVILIYLALNKIIVRLYIQNIKYNTEFNRKNSVNKNSVNTLN